jgi:hypothetical protein
MDRGYRHGGVLRRPTSRPRSRIFLLNFRLVLTRGLGIVPNPTSDNLSPKKPQIKIPPKWVLVGPGLSCPGSSAVAEADRDKSSPIEKW